jgi:hypothetical protein
MPVIPTGIFVNEAIIVIKGNYNNTRYKDNRQMCICVL